MAKMMRKLVVLLLVVSLCSGMVGIRAKAAGAEEDSLTVTVSTEDITDAEGNVVGTKTTQTTTDADGNVLEQIVTQTVMDVAETDSGDIYTRDTQVDTHWNGTSTQSQQEEPQQPADNQTQQTGHTSVTEVTGSETAESHIHSDKDTGIQTYSGSTQGSEDTLTTQTTTTVTTTTDTLLDAQSQTETKQDGEVWTEADWSEPTQTGQGQWTADPQNSSTGSYTPDSAPQSSKPVDADIDVDEDPLASADAVLELKPGKEDGAKLYISIEDALENDIVYTEGAQADGSVVTFQRDAKGNVIGYIIYKATPDAGNSSGPADPEDIVSGQSHTAMGAQTTVYTKPEGYTPCTDVPIYADGQQIGTRTVKEIVDAAGQVIGYEITEVTTRIGDSSQEASTEPAVTAPETFTLPEKPEEPEAVTDAYGMTTTVTVQEILDGSNVIGYETVTTITDADGNVVSQESRHIYGTRTSSTISVSKQPETDRITTTTVTTVYGTVTTQQYTVTTPGTVTREYSQGVQQDVYQLVNTEDGLFFLYRGKMYAVTAMGTHGDVTLSSLKPDISGLEPGTSDGAVSTTTLLRNPENFDEDNGIATGYALEYVGYGLETAIRVDYTNGNTLAHQFKLVDRDGNIHYVLCADLGVSAVRGADYNMTNVSEAAYFQREGAAAKIEAIALSGYWGTQTGVGSLENVKQLLRNAKRNGQISWLPDAYIENLTPGEALTATQAAIWYYGNSAESQNMSDQYVTGAVYQSSGGTRSATAEEASTVNALYQVLINLDPAAVNNTTTEFITQENFAASATITVKEKAVDAGGNVEVDANSNTQTYLTDLTFSLAVKKSSLTGNLKLTVTDEYGKVLGEAQLATEDSSLLGTLLAEDSVGSGTYTLKDIKIAEGVTIQLNLSGTQNLSQGVYLYTAAVYSDSQTFVGVGSGERDVNLSVEMELEVADPQAKVRHTRSTWTETRTDELAFTKTDSYEMEKEGTVTTQIQTTDRKTYGTMVVTDVMTEQSTSGRTWQNSYQYSIMTVDEDDTETKTDPPKTGDAGWLLAVVSVLSLSGAVVLGKKRDEE